MRLKWGYGDSSCVVFSQQIKGKPVLEIRDPKQKTVQHLRKSDGRRPKGFDAREPGPRESEVVTKPGRVTSGPRDVDDADGPSEHAEACEHKLALLHSFPHFAHATAYCTNNAVTEDHEQKRVRGGPRPVHEGRSL